MNKPIRRLVCWSLVLIWMIVIFGFSAQPAGQSSAVSGGLIELIVRMTDPAFSTLPPSRQALLVESWQHIARKTAHLLAYTVLGILSMTALLPYAMDKKRRTLTAFLICVVYATTDEVHQLFVSGRSAQLTDVVIDSLGALIGIGLVILFGCLQKRRRHKGGLNEMK